MTSRREFLQYLAISLGGTALLSACGDSLEIVATPPGNNGRFYTQREMALVTRISDLMIPRTETFGALDVNVPGYLDGMMVDWASSETREKHRLALSTILEGLNKGVAGDFLTATPDTARQALVTLDAQAFTGGADLGGYRDLKGLITAVYFASEEGALKEMKWVPVPGRWDPSVDLMIAE